MTIQVVFVVEAELRVPLCSNIEPQTPETTHNPLAQNLTTLQTAVVTQLGSPHHYPENLTHNPDSNHKHTTPLSHDLHRKKVTTQMAVVTQLEGSPVMISNGNT